MNRLKVFGSYSLAVILAILFNVGNAWATTLYVHPTDSIYTTIGAAVNAAVTGDEIVVGPGTYPAIDVNKLVYIRSEKGPKVTKIISSGEFGVKFTSGANGSSLTGFYIKASNCGIYIYSKGESDYCQNININNNIFEGSGMYGLYMDVYNKGHIYYVNIDNNVISANGIDGIYLESHEYYGGSVIFYCVISNNIVINNGGYGIKANTTDRIKNNAYYNNDIFNNTNGSSYYVSISESDGNIFVDPKFIDAGTGNYMLQSMSPCINAGRQGLAFLDPDGTRNNMGVYGGPGAASFWPYPESGPVVTNLSVTPASVPKGGTITIKATGSVR